MFTVIIIFRALFFYVFISFATFSFYLNVPAHSQFYLHTHAYSLNADVVTCCIVHIPMDSKLTPIQTRPKKKRNKLSLSLSLIWFFSRCQTSKQVALFRFYIDVMKRRNQVSQQFKHPYIRLPTINSSKTNETHTKSNQIRHMCMCVCSQ